MADKLRLKEKIIIALDVATAGDAVALVEQLEEALVFKVGMELFTAAGPPLLEEMLRRGKRPFLDLKYHDIPNTVAGAVRAAVGHGVYMMTLHAAGGKEMMARAVETVRQASGERGVARPLLLGVTVLTSFREAELSEIGCPVPVTDQVLRLAALAKAARLDGVVCSPHEIESIKKELGPDFLAVTPGIRPAWAAAQDQKRIMTPAQALEKGADFVVIGRPITAAASPREALRRVVEELEETD